MERARVLAFAAIALLGSPAFALAGGTQTGGRPQQAFVELHADVYTRGFDIEAVRAGEFHHPYYPTVNITDFDWVTSPVTKMSWWIRVEELRFLLPLIASEQSEDHALALEYFYGWLAAHDLGAAPNPGAWREPMTVARRGMVLVYWHDRVRAGVAPDTALLQVLERELERHANRLTGKFDADSNHGLEEAMGTIEVSRVVDTPAFRALGFERLSSIVSALVSEQGIQLEHSPGYHFLMLQTLRRYGNYLRTLEWTPEHVLAQIDETSARMQRGGSYLYDHGGRVLQLGDTDSLQVRPEDTYDDGALPAVLFDRDAAIAVYKGRGDDRRYVAMSITTTRPLMWRHYQNDAGAVYYADDGETILGDGGAFEYSRSPFRAFFVSAPGHNRVYHSRDHQRPRAGIDVGDNLRMRDENGSVTFGLRVNATSYKPSPSRKTPDEIAGLTRKCAFGRELRLPPGEGIVVRDTLLTGWAHGEDMHDIAWHTGPDVSTLENVVEEQPSVWSANIVTLRGRRFRIRMEIRGAPQWSVRVVRGEEAPVMGWHSPAPRVRRARRSVVLSIAPGPSEVTVTTSVAPLER